MYQMKLVFQNHLQSLKKYIDLNWILNYDIKRLFSKYVFNINNEIINWFFRRQSIVIFFTSEIEYKRQTQTIKKSIWLRNILI